MIPGRLASVRRSGLTQGQAQQHDISWIVYACFGVSPNLATISLHDTLANGQAQSRAGRCRAVQSFEGLEN